MGAVVLGVIVVVFASLVLLLERYWRKWTLVNRIPGPRAYFGIGNALQLRPLADDFFAQIIGTCKMFVQPQRLCRVWLGPKPYILIYGAKEAESVYNNPKLINKSTEYRFLHKWLGLGLLTAPAHLWRPRRKQLTPTFHYDILKDFLHAFNTQAQVLCTKLAVDVDKEIDLYTRLTLCTLDVICETAMGRELNAQSSPRSAYVDAVYGLAELVHLRQKAPWFWPEWSHMLFGAGRREQKYLKVLHDFTSETIAQRKAMLEEYGGVKELREATGRLAFLDLLLEMVENEKLTLNDVHDEVNTFMMEGHDTTSAGLNWLIHLLGNDERVQKRLHAELDDVFGSDGDYFRAATTDDLNKLQYTEACIKEALRLFPPVPMFAREVIETTDVAGHRVPPGTTLTIIPYMVHRDPEQWPRPDEFIPERFMPKDEEEKSECDCDNMTCANCLSVVQNKRHAYAFTPFSASSRNCIGQRFALLEEKVVISHLLRRYSIKSVHQRHEVHAKAELILRACEGTRVVLHDRWSGE